MAEQLIDEIISDLAYQQVDRLQGDMDALLKKFEATAEAATAVDKVLRGAQGIPELNKAIQENLKLEKEMIRQQQEMEKLNKQKIATEKELERLKQAKIKSDSDALKLENLKNKESERSRKNALDEANAYARLKKQYKEVADEAKRLSAEYGVNNEKAKEASKRAKELHDRLLEIESAVGQNQRNVGNYTGSAKIIVDALERARQKMKQVEDQFGTMGPEAMAARTEVESLQRITDNPQFLNVAAKVGDTNKELKFFSQRLNELEDAGLKNSQVYREVLQRMAQLKDQLGDTRAEIQAMSSDTRQFDLLAGAVNFAADTMQTFYGATQLAGMSEKDAAEATATLMAIQSLANGVKGIATELTTKGTAANIIYAKAQALVATATNTTTAATARWIAVGKLLLATGIIGGVILLAMHFIKLAKATSEAQRNQKLFSDVLKESAKAAGDELAKLQTLRAVAENRNLNLKERKKAVDELQKQYPDYFKNIKDEIILQGKASEAYDKTRAAILENAKTRAIESKLSELASRELEIQFDNEDKLRLKRQAQIQDNINKQKQQRDAAKGIPSTVTPEEFLAGAGAVQSLNTQLEDANKELAQISSDRDFLLSKITTPGLAFEKETKEKIKRNTSDIIKLEQDTRRALFAASQQELQDRINAQSAILADEKKTYAERYAASQQYYDLSLQLQKNQKEFTIKEIQQQADEEIKELEKKGKEEGLTRKQIDDQILAIKANAKAKQVELEAKFNSDIIALDYQSEEQRYSLREKVQADYEAHRIAIHETELENIQSQYDKELLKLDRKFEKGRISEEKYNKKKLLLQVNLQAALLKEDIAFTKTAIELAEARAAASGKQEDIDNVIAAKQKLAALEIQIQQTVFDFTKKKNKETLDDIQNVLEKVANYAGKLTDIIGGFVGAAAEREKNRLQKEIDSLEEEKQKEIENINSSVLSEQKKADKIAVIEARAEARRSELERRQKAADHKKAAFDKAATIAKIIVETALAVVKALPNIPLAIATGAFGAAQLAVAIATPLPQYAKGRKGGKAEWALTGEAGTEVIEHPDGKKYIVNRPTITYLPKDAKVIPNHELTQQTLQKAALSSFHVNQSGELVDESINIEEALDKHADRIVKAYEDSKTNVFITHDWKGAQVSIQRMNNWERWVNDNIH